MKRIQGIGLSIAMAHSLAGPAEAGEVDFEVVRVATGLSLPTFATSPPGDRSRLFITEQTTGRILILNLETYELDPIPFLDIDGLATGNEQGLLGLAFHPDYPTNPQAKKPQGFFYVYYSRTGGDSVISRFSVSPDPDVADAASELVLLEIAQPQGNHNGGWVGFGPDGYLYISSGDGGNANDEGGGHTEPGGNAQDLTANLLGKMLRIDVDGDDFPNDDARNYAIPPDNPFVGQNASPEIWAYGLRNPWRASFDMLTGDLYIGDVGQNTREEIDFQPAASSGGENYGWRLREGTIQTPGGVGGPKPPGAIDPIYDYGRSLGNVVIGGSVYRGRAASLQGLYFFSDNQAEDVYSLRFDGSQPGDFDGTNFTDLTNWSDDPAFDPDVGQIDNPTAIGQDDRGELYIVDGGGDVFRVPEPALALLQAAALFGLALRLRGSALGLESAALAPAIPDRRPHGLR